MALRTKNDHPENSDEGKRAKADAVAADDAVAEVQSKMDEATDQGYRGVAVDPTPNEAYTLQGAASGAPTPETDADAAAKAKEGQAEAERLANGVSER